METKLKPIKMEDLLKSAPSELTALPQVNMIVEGKIIEKKSNALYVDLKQWGTGIIYGKEFYETLDKTKKMQINDTVIAKVVDPENEDGYIELSLKEAGKEMTWNCLKEKMASGEIIPVKILAANRGGLMIDLENIKGFLPVSQLSIKNYPRVEGSDKNKILTELRKFVGKLMDVKIIDVNPSEEKLIVSEKAIELEKVKKILANYKEGDIVEGEVTGVVDFGAFIKFGENLEGLSHISELDWKLIENPNEVIKVGDKVKAKIVSINNDRVTLSLKALKPNPWLDIEEKYKVGDIVKGKVTKLNPFGAFIQLNKDIQGLCHISDFGSEKKMAEELKINKKYDFKITSIEKDEYKLALKLVVPPARHTEQSEKSPENNSNKNDKETDKTKEKLETKIE